MLIPGLVSITFRKKGVWEITELMKKADLHAVEWGGDVHVPPADTNAVNLAKDVSASHDIKIVSYGSYHKCNGDDEEIEKNVSTAALLGAETIRVWAGTLWSNDYNDETRREQVEKIRKVCKTAKKYGITVSPEFHPASLTDELWSALQLVDEIHEDNFRLYWQPNQFKDDEYNIKAIKSVLPYLTNVHVFSWKETNMYPLVWGEKLWRQYIEIMKESDKTHNLMLEFICDGSDEQFLKDAETLHKWLD